MIKTKSEEIKSDNNKETYVFIDFSNVYVGFYNYITKNYKRYNMCNPKMDYNMLFSIVENNRNIKKKVLISSKNPKKNKKLDNEKKIFSELGYEVFMLERINNKERGVDELLHGKIMESLLYSDIPGSIVIATGDGKSSDYTDNSFYKICIQALKLGWEVTIVSWRYQLNKNYILGVELYSTLKNNKIKDNFNIIYLEEHIDMLVV